MILKLLETIKNFSLEDKELCDVIQSSYHFYATKQISALPDENKQKAFSVFLRFFRSFNSNKKFEEEAFNSFLKEVLRGKPNSISLIQEKVNEIITVQTKRNNFSDSLSCRHLNYFIEKGNISSKNKLGFVENNLYQVKNISFKINITISNDFSNRVLSPEIFLYLTLNNGRTLCLFFDMKLFQELRKCLAMHVKKMIDNEAVNFLK